MLVRGKVNQAFDGIGDIRTPSAAIGRYWRGVGVNHLRLHVERRDLVDTAHGDRKISRTNEGAHHAVVGA